MGEGEAEERGSQRILIVSLSLLSAALVSRATERNRRPEGAAWYEDPLAGAGLGRRRRGTGVGVLGAEAGMGCRCRRPPRDQHSCGEENPAGLALEPAVCVRLHVCTIGKVLPRLRAHCASGNRSQRCPSTRTFTDASLIFPVTAPWYGCEAHAGVVVCVSVCVCVCARALVGHV